MRPALAATCTIVLFNTPVRAGPNSNGAIIVHTNDSYTYLSSTVCTTPLGPAIVPGAPDLAARRLASQPKSNRSRGLEAISSFPP